MTFRQHSCFVFSLLFISSAAVADEYEIVLRNKEGRLVVPATINNIAAVDFLIDTGSSLTLLPVNVIELLIHKGTLEYSEVVDKIDVTLSDGSSIRSDCFRVRTLQIGREHLRDVAACSLPADATAIMGMNVLQRFRWYIDGKRQVLVVGAQGDGGISKDTMQ